MELRAKSTRERLEHVRGKWAAPGRQGDDRDGSHTKKKSDLELTWISFRLFTSRKTGGTWRVATVYIVHDQLYP